MLTELLFHTNDLEVRQGTFTKKIVNFDMRPGEIIHLKGDNGSGKTTFVKTLIGELPPFAGKIVSNIKLHNITYLRQDLLREIVLPITVGEWLRSYNAEEIGKKVLGPIFFERKFSQLSGGEKQKLSIVAKIGPNCKLLVLDEPFNHVDANSRRELMTFFRKLIEDKYVLGILFIDHHVIEQVKVIEF